MIRAARSHWPESHRFQPINDDHLRKWLQAKCGHAVVTFIDCKGMTGEAAIKAVSAALAAAKDHVFPAEADGRFYVIQSKSIDFDSLPHLAACALFDAVADVIECETGLKVVDIMPPISEKRTGKVEQFAEVPL